MLSKVYSEVFCFFLTLVLPNVVGAITNPAIGILTESNVYLAQIKEWNYTSDELYLVYHHNDPVYALQSLASNTLIHRIYVCSPSTIYIMDLRVGSHVVPLTPVDDTPCRSSLTYLPGEASLLWAVRRGIIQLNFNEMSREGLWNSTSPIVDMIFNDTNAGDNSIEFYLSIAIANQQAAILHCRADRRVRLLPFQSCLFINSGYRDVATLAIDDNRLYVADRGEQQIYVLTLSPSGFVLHKDVLPLNTSTVADIQSMFVYDHHLVWLTASGHVRIVSLITYQVRNLFWLDEQLRTTRLVSFAQWPNRTTTTSASTTTERPTTVTVTSTRQSTTLSTSASMQVDSTTVATDVNSSPWKATTFVTSIILGIALFLCAAMITCVLLNYRLGRVVPSSFTNILHVFRNRATVATPRPTLLEESLT